MHKTVYGVASDDLLAAHALAVIEQIGVPGAGISLVWRRALVPPPAAAPRGTGTAGLGPERAGALGNWPVLTPITVRDMGRVLAAGPIRTAFDGSATGGLMRLAPALTWAGIPVYESRFYAGLVYLGRILLLVDVADANEGDQVRQAWEACGMSEVSSPVTSHDTTVQLMVSAAPRQR